MKYNEVLNKEYIMKAVRHCVDGAGCADCPYEFAPDCASIEELLCYIKKLTEENERLWKTGRHLAQIVIEAAIVDPVAKEMLEGNNV